MELWLTLVVLYAWQCLAWLRAPSAVFGPRWLGASDLHRRGVQLLSPWPRTDAIIASALPFELTPDSRRIGFDPVHALGERSDVAIDDLAVDRQNTRLRIDGRVIAHAASRAQARHWQRSVDALATCAAADRRDRWQQLIGYALDVETLRTRFDDARSTTRWLSGAATLSLVASFVLVPALGLLLGSEFVLAKALPALGALHLVTLGLAFACHRRLFPELRGERWEELCMAALYPPTLWRRPAAWVDAATTGFHPLAWVRLLEDEDLAARFWRRERARLLQRPRASDESAATALELEGIEQHWPEIGSAAPPRERRDPEAASYCPVCWDDFRNGFEHCAACDADTLAYAPESA